VGKHGISEGRGVSSQVAAGSAFAPTADILRADEAVAALVAAVAPVEGHEDVALFDADGRVLALDLVARRTVPPLDNAAMDGYAVRCVDLLGAETRLPVGGRIAAGSTLGRPVRAGEALRIFTGAPVPEGADAVIPQERATAEDGFVRLPPTAAGSNVRPAGENFRCGDMLLKAGKRLLPQDVAHAASAGHATLPVRRRPEIALFSTGDEVREPGFDSDPGTIINSNVYVLHGLVRRLGCVPRYLGIVPDRPDVLRAALAEAVGSGVDAILTTGGVSMGEEDHVKSVVESLGQLDFWRIAIRPGRPLAFGRVGAVPFIGLPGNPVAAMVTFLMFARSMLLRLAGAEVGPPERFPAIAGFSFKKRAGRREWLRGTVGRDSAGRLVAQRFPNEGSGVFSSVVASTGLIELHEDMRDVAAGDTVEYRPFSGLLA
jgi:molybdopterin molybdotransferase